MKRIYALYIAIVVAAFGASGIYGAVTHNDHHANVAPTGT